MLKILITIIMIFGCLTIIALCQISKQAEEWEQEIQRLKEEENDK